MDEFLKVLVARRSELFDTRAAEFTARQAILTTSRAAGHQHLSEEDLKAYDERSSAIKTLDADIAGMDARIQDLADEAARSGRGNPIAEQLRAAQHRGGDTARGVAGDAEAWASRAAQGIQAMGGEHRAITSGTLDVPTLIQPTITPMARPQRLIDLLVNRIMLSGNAFEYYKQSVRTNNAATVADNAVKPTSVFTTLPIQDRARVIAHLSEAAPKRLLQDIQGLQAWLWSELAEGVLDALERQVIAGDGTGENMTGILSMAGTVPVAYTSSPIITLRKALTLSQLAGEQPNAIILSPVDAEVIDMTRAGDDGPFLTGGFANDSGGYGGSSKNIFGSSSITRVISPSVPSGTAVLGDWSKIALYVREAVTVEVDMSGVLFTKNQFVARAEGRFGVGHLRPSSFFIADLNP